MATNYFALGIDAKRYADGRPYIHPTAIAAFRKFAGIEQPVLRALDVGCGTGQSSIALTDIAQTVVGIDASAEMLAQTKPHKRVQYQHATAEEFSSTNEPFDVVTVALAFHWLDQDRFLAQVHPLLRPDGWLVIYNSAFTSQMKEDSTFSDWFKAEYLGRYPTPPRNRTPITEQFVEQHGFTIRGDEEFSDEVKMTNERFTDYQISTTNIISALESGNVRIDDVAKWLHDGLAPFFGDESERTFLFAGKIWYLQRT